MFDTPRGSVIAICISPAAGKPMQLVQEVEAIAGAGLKGDRYCTGNGSFNKSRPGYRAVTLINGIFFQGSGFEFEHCRRNIITDGVELMSLIGKEFTIGNVSLFGIKYNEPCGRPSRLMGKERSFQEAFFDRGGLIADITEGGTIKVGSVIIPPPKSYKP